MWLVTALGLLLARETPAANSGRVWLVVVASDKSPAAIAKKAEQLAGTFPHALVFSVSDCGDKADVFGLAAEVAADAASAEAAIVRVRQTVEQAYLKRCDVKPQSLLAHRISVVDTTIANVPSTVVNWGDEDRVSTLFGLADGRAVAAIRYFESDPEDPLEGKRTRLLLLNAGRSSPLTSTCLSPELPVTQRTLLAVQCVTGQAADSLLHDVLVFSQTGKLLLTVEHCRTPRWVNDNMLSCRDEEVDANGVLKTRNKTVRVAAVP